MPGFHSISIRVTFWLSLIVVIFIVALIGTINPRQRFFDQKLVDSDRVAHLIETHLVAEMLAGEPDNIQNHLELIPNVAGIYRVELINPASLVRFSTEPSRVGRTVDRMTDASCVHCHDGVSRPPDKLVYDSQDHGRVFSSNHTLANKPECRRCHEDDGETFGSLIVEVSLSDADLAELQLGRWVMLMGGGLLVVLVLGMGGVIHSQVGRRAKKLVDTMRKVEEGDLAIEVASRSKDELGQLERAFQRMVSRLHALYAGMEEKIRQRTDSLYETQAQVVHQEKLVGIGQLAAGVAHEIGNPLTAIDSIVQLLALDSDDPAVQKKVRMIQDQINRISEIVHNMADLSRPLSMQIQAVDLNMLLHSVLGLVRYDARFGPIKVETDLAENLPAVNTVEDRLFAVFLNLALNAADSMPEGGTLAIRTERHDDEIHVSFTDTGHGIRAEHFERIFEPYFTTKARGQGTGLG
ncbi:MAG: HAMP domain-containing protein, partial [Gemmatimonadetes bacterium]|nr:HAMP domain-containing protein [Gemmatimonadota bacterium]